MIAESLRKWLTQTTETNIPHSLNYVISTKLQVIILIIDYEDNFWGNNLEKMFTSESSPIRPGICIL